MEKFQGMHNGYEVEAWTELGATGTHVTFHADVLEKYYDTYAAIEKALDAFDLKQRKGFKNGEAWMITPQYSWSTEREKFVRVTVTSTDGFDEAWVKTAEGKRSKERRQCLFISKSAAEKYLKESEAMKKAHEKAIEELKGRRDLWVPQH